ncbi:28S ribosomal protein S18c, mitochondrial isoform X2 [Polypterus senegalus]|uniref:28S ribosomal protein S18c, mitochondrial isoform X2 n=1 Tax=Polypterus senegalus TaxID=55291 RepID=UPI00196635D8|nr:28S ribosomal protein S18c, mitochondrial isoform X2 [Polypterus senegalus]
MFAVRKCRIFARCTTLQSFRSNAGSSQQSINTQQQRDMLDSDKPMKIENPYKEPPKKCTLCGISVDYKNVQLLSQFISPNTGRIYGRHITGLCGKKQREISKAIKKSHYMGFMPVVFKEPAFLKDPNVCSIKHHE